MPEARGREGRFFRYELRTTDPAGARAFYRAVVGPALDHPSVDVVSLPEAARMRGAPPHWLGHVGVADVEAVARTLAAAGGSRLGPAVRGTSGSLRAVVRDPFGAVFALAGPPAADMPAEGPVRWHALNVDEPERALELYAAAFGWAPPATPAWGADLPRLHDFAWAAGEQGVGTVVGTAGFTGVHPHWLFLFGVPDVERAAATARALGGTVLPPLRTPSGGLAVAGEDPQGAAFGLIDHVPETR